jgi:hypothetical protein
MLARCFLHAYPQVGAELVRGFSVSPGIAAYLIKPASSPSVRPSAHQAGVS